MRHRLEPPDQAAGDVEVGVRLDHLGSEERSQFTGVDLDAVADGRQIAHIRREQLEVVVTAGTVAPDFVAARITPQQEVHVEAAAALSEAQPGKAQGESIRMGRESAEPHANPRDPDGYALRKQDFRDRILDAAQELILEKRERLVVLTGPGGSGKTRLAIETARSLEAKFSGGVVYVPLAAIRDPELVVSTIAHALGGVEHAAGNELPSLIASLEATDGPLLLVLDNFEQVVDAAPKIGEMVAASPQLTVLVTSREVLQLSAEHAIPVSPLELPPAAEGE